MSNLVHITTSAGLNAFDVLDNSGQAIYRTEEFASIELARTAAIEWCKWAEDVPCGKGDSIYYILAVPITWPGPPPGAHRYSGLHFKIGRATNVLKRFQDLRTGTSEDLIIHALEPGSALLESQRHEQFASDRRQGEWFAASPALCQHVLDTWKKTRILPPEHQQKVLSFAHRSALYRRLRSEGFNFDMINPSLNEPWFGKVFVDLVYTPLLRSK